MNICVYGAASNDISPNIIKKTEDLGREMAERGHALVFGGGNNGMMGASARGAHEGGGEIIGIAPRFFNADGVFFAGCTEFFLTDTMRERKKLMEEKSDAFIVTPGGIGTFDEFFEILTLRSLGQHTKAIAVYNIDGYYNALEDLLDNAVKGGFMKKAAKDLIGFFDNEKELLDYIENYKGETVTAFDMKNIGSENDE